ncbi:hypothetical protein GCM10011375_00270 [Hymenobacter qilianensis]|uniref:Uncharacterized protein n=2 Tax=Hymenobacter qilianensis TaxID=1385715 RepID=A0ACB5PKV8_9BACT|nr:hypothetical protein [Hymenobacter qilianensis]QNP50997.1 hypothetical protein H9L05_12740 [Hymenobacter qilianensis]GGF48730.1 hypothetical protein GCM10011375_00270 [Hymenobacter qilianensis]
MKLQQRYALAILLVATAPLASCDYEKGPGKDTQFDKNFNTEAAKEPTSNEVARDSVNRVQNVQPPLGEGSAADQQQSVDKAMNSAPSGNTATSPQTASGQPAPQQDKAQDGNSQNAKQAPSKASGTDQSGNGGTTAGGTTSGSGGGQTTQQ